MRMVVTALAIATVSAVRAAAGAVAARAAALAAATLAAALAAATATAVAATLATTLATTTLAATTLATTATLAAATAVAAMPTALTSATLAATTTLAAAALAAATLTTTVAAGSALDDAKQSTKGSQGVAWVCVVVAAATIVVLVSMIVATTVVATPVAMVVAVPVAMVVAVPVTMVVAVPVAAVVAVPIVLAVPVAAPAVAHSESVVLVVFKVQRRAEAIVACPAWTLHTPLIEAPIALDPELCASLVTTIIDGAPVPTAPEIHRAVIDRILPELVGTARAVAIPAAVERVIDSPRTNTNRKFLCARRSRTQHRCADQRRRSNRRLQEVPHLSLAPISA